MTSTDAPLQRFVQLIFRAIENTRTMSLGKVLISLSFSLSLFFFLVMSIGVCSLASDRITRKHP